MPLINDGCRGLCNRIQVLTEQRLAFDKKMHERVRTRSPATSPRRDVPASELLQKGDLSAEGKITYMKLQGDQLLHLAEMAHHDGLSAPECEGVAAEALEAYLAAQLVASEGDRYNNSGNVAVGALPELHPLRLELALRISSVLLHMLGRPVEAWEAAYSIYQVAAERPARLGPRGLAVTQFLRDHLASIDVRREQEDHEDVHGATRGSCGSGEGADAWSFLGVSTGLHEAAASKVTGDRLRGLAQVKQARACMNGVAKVLLGTMEQANVVQSALKQVFAFYSGKHPLLAQKCDDGKHVWLQRQQVSLQAFQRHGPLLSWAGFETVCADFKLTASSASQKPNLTKNTPDGSYLIDKNQARIAFVSATHEPAVASFPEGNCKTPPPAARTTGRPKDERRQREEEDAYWRGMERVVLSGSTLEATGLNFRQFVDALARCGLISSSRNGAGGHLDLGVGGVGVGARVPQRQPVSAAERVQVVFIEQMRLLDRQYVDNILHAQETGRKTADDHDRAANAGREFRSTGAEDETKSTLVRGGGTARRETGGAMTKPETRRPSMEPKFTTLTPIKVGARGAIATARAGGALPGSALGGPRIG